LKLGGSSKELRKSADKDSVGGGGGGASPGRGGEPKNLDKSDPKPDERRPLGGGRGANPATIPPPGSVSPARPGGAAVAGELKKSRDDLGATVRLTEPLIVRQYAHQHSEHGFAGGDFAETLCWNPVLIVPTSGAEVAFDLADDIVGYRIIAAGHTLDGRVGSITSRIDVRRPERKETDKARDPIKP
jgi:hypothetical protein